MNLTCETEQQVYNYSVIHNRSSECDALFMIFNENSNTNRNIDKHTLKSTHTGNNIISLLLYEYIYIL